MNDDFYIGYDTRVPPRARRQVFAALAGLLALAVALSVWLVASQRPFADSSFAFGESRPFTGILRARPYPVLDAGVERWLLVAPGKRGADAMVSPFDGQAVTLPGSTIRRGDRTMIEITPGTIARAPEISAQPDERVVSLGEMTIEGEVVDGKCYLGVMNPGEGAVHRDCAVACIRGGVPPLFAARASDGRIVLFLLVTPAGEPVGPRVAPLVGRPIAIRGQVSIRTATQEWILAADPAAYRVRDGF
jgi:hypothetical protein